MKVTKPGTAATVAAALAIAALPLSAVVPDQVARVRHSPLNAEASVQSLVSTMSDNALTLKDIHRLLTIKNDLPRLMESKGAYICVKDEQTCYCYKMSLRNNKVNFEAVPPTESLPKGATLVFA